MKICNTCGKSKRKSSFYPGRRACKQCRIIYAHAYRAMNITTVRLKDRLRKRKPQVS